MATPAVDSCLPTEAADEESPETPTTVAPSLVADEQTDRPETLPPVTAVVPRARRSRCDARRLCRLCYTGDGSEPVLRVCECRGQNAFAHKSCLQSKLRETYTDSCYRCEHMYERLTSQPSTLCEGVLKNDGAAFAIIIFGLLELLLVVMCVTVYRESAKKDTPLIIFGVTVFGGLTTFFIIVIVVAWTDITKWRQKHPVCTHDIRDLDDSCVDGD